MKKMSRALGLLALGLLFTATNAMAEGPRWGDFKRDNCKANVTNVRQYSAILWDIPFGQSWEAACAATEAVVKGQNIEQKFTTPTRCKNAGGHMWGEFDVSDPKDCPNFTAPKDDGCQERENYSGKFRRYSSQMFDVPEGMDPLQSCKKSTVDVNGAMMQPGNCTSPNPLAFANNAKDLSFHYWAQFFVEDKACGPAPKVFSGVGLTPTTTAEEETLPPAPTTITQIGKGSCTLLDGSTPETQPATGPDIIYIDGQPCRLAPGSKAQSTGKLPTQLQGLVPITGKAAPNTPPATAPAQPTPAAPPVATTQPTPAPTPTPAAPPTEVTAQRMTAPIAAPAAPGCDAAKVAQCKSLLQDQVPWSGKSHDDPSFRHWQEGNMQKLCNCTDDAAKTVQCFQDEIYKNGDSWVKAIDSCAKK